MKPAIIWKQILLVLSLLLSAFVGKGQDISMSINVLPPYPVQVDYYLDRPENFLLNISNLSNESQELFFGIQLISDNGLTMNTLEGLRPGSPYEMMPNEATLLNGEEWDILNLDYSYPGDFTISGISTDQQADILVNRVLPEGNYQICLLAFDYNTGALLTTACSNEFYVEYATAPIIISPSEDSDIDPDEYVEFIFSWIPPVAPNTDATIEYDLKIIDVTENGGTAVDVEDLFLDPTVPAVIDETNIMDVFYIHPIIEDPLFIEGHTYVMRVTAVDPMGEQVFQNDGHSEVLTFTYGLENSLQSEASLVFAAGDTLPFQYLPYIFKHPNYSSDYTYLSYELKRENLEHPELLQYTYGEIEMPDGPKVYLKDLSGTAVTQDQSVTFAFNSALNQESEFPISEKGNTINWTVDYELEDDAGTITYGTASSTYTYGMGTPVLLFPLDGQAYQPGEVYFEFQTMQTPSTLLPDYIQYLERSNGEAEELWPTEIDEHWVFQVSKSSNFSPDSLLYFQDQRIQLETAAEVTEDALLDSVFASIDFEYDLDSTGTYFWRVIWLKDPAMLIDSTSILDSTSFYRSSPIWSFEINEDATVSGDNQLTDCDFDCYYTDPISSSPAEDMTTFDSLHIGLFSIIDLNALNEEDGALSGEGIIPLQYEVLGIQRTFRVMVEFEEVKVNAAGRIYEGEVTAKEDASFDLTDINQDLEEWDNRIPDAATEGLSEYLNWFDDINAGLWDGNQDLGLPLGIHLNVSGYRMQLGLTAITFTPDNASSNAVAILDMPALKNTQLVPFAAKDVCMTPGGFGSEFLLYMAEDFVVSQDGETQFRLKGSGDTNSDSHIRANASYLEIDCEGVKELAIRGEVAFPRALIVPEDIEEGTVIDTGQVLAHFGTVLERGVTLDTSTQEEVIGLHWIADLSIDPFQINGLKGWGFEITNAYLDMSDLENPSNIQFPANYDSTLTDDTWQGIYIKSANLITPKDFLTGPRSYVQIEDMIVDPKITMKVEVQNLLEANEGNVDGWAFSIDTVQLNIAANTFEEAKMQGQIGTPLFDEDTYLKYTALIDRVVINEDSSRTDYNFTIQPADTVSIPMWVAQAELEANSYLLLHMASGNAADSAYLETFLTGAINVDAEAFVPDDYDGTAPAAVPQLPGLDFELTYHSREGFSDVHFGFVSETAEAEEEDGSSGGGMGRTGLLEAPNYEDMWASVETHPEMFPTAPVNAIETAQNVISGFPITIEDWSYEFEGNNFSLNLEPQLALQSNSDGFSISTTLAFNSTLVTNGLKVKKFKFDGIQVECVALDASVSNMGIKGDLCFYNERNDDGEGKKGMKGALNVVVPGIGLGVNLAAEFGTMVEDSEADFGTEDNYGFWRVDGLFYLGSAGIPIYYITLHGLGGGIAVNMKETSDSDDISATLITNSAVIDSAAVKDEVAWEDIKTSGKEWEPHFGARALSFTVVLAVIRQELVNMDLTFETTWQQGEGIQSITLGGDVYMLTPIADRPTAQLRADTELSWYFHEPGQTSMTGMLDFYMNLELVKGAYEDNRVVTGNFHSQNFGGDNGNGYWDLELGNYEEPGMVDLQLGLDWLSISAESYKIAGHHVPTTLPPLPDEIQTLLNGQTTSDGDNSFLADESVTDEEEERGSQDLENMRTGFGLAYGKKFSANFNLNYSILYADLNATLGFDFLVSHDADRICYIDDGSSVEPGINGWYGTGQIYTGLEGDLGVKVKVFGDTLAIKLMELGAAVALEGGGLNPIWLEGRATVFYSVLGGTFEGSSRFAITAGDQCIPTYGDPLANMEFIAETLPGDENGVNPYTEPIVSFHIPMEEIIYIPVYDVEGNETIAKFKPYLSEFEVNEYGVGQWNFDSEQWNTNNTEVVYRSTQPFTPKTGPVSPRFDLKAVVKADRYDSNDGWVPLEVEGEVWNETREVTFRTAKHPDKFDDNYVSYSIPLNRQRYFLQDELPSTLTTTSSGQGIGAGIPMGGGSSTGSGGPITQKLGRLDFYQDMSGFFPTSDTDGTYEYFLRFIAIGEEDIDVDIISNSGTELTFALPDLENETLYAVQVIQKNTQKTIQVDQALQDLLNRGLQDEFQTANEENDTYTEWSVISQASAIDRSQTVADNEHLIYVWFFQTSAFDKLEDKVENLELIVGSTGIIWVENDEAFDEYDLMGYEDKYGNPVAPRVKISDPFLSDYHEDGAGDLIENQYTAYLSHMASNPVIYNGDRYQQFSLLNPDLQTLNYDWDGEKETVFTSFTDYQAPLRDALINNAFSGLAGMADMLPGISSPPMPSTDADKFYFGYNTFSKVEADAAELEDWMYAVTNFRVMLNIYTFVYPFEDYFEDEYPAFLDWQEDINDRGVQLYRYGFENGWVPSGPMATGGSGPLYHLKITAEKAYESTFSNSGTTVTKLFRF